MDEYECSCVICTNLEYLSEIGQAYTRYELLYLVCRVCDLENFLHDDVMNESRIVRLDI